MPRPENPPKIQPGSPQGCSPAGSRLSLGCCSLPSAFCLSGYKSPCLKPAKKSNSLPKAIHGSALVPHLLSQLDTAALLAPLQLGHVPTWAWKSCPPLPAPVFGLWLWRCSSPKCLWQKDQAAQSSRLLQGHLLVPGLLGQDFSQWLHGRAGDTTVLVLSVYSMSRSRTCQQKGYFSALSIY